jgi:sulfite reductase (ferredoxin)
MNVPANGAGKPPKPNKPNKVEAIKAASNGLRGDLAVALENGTSGFDEANKVLIKFHGLYQQEDRDERKANRADRGAEKTHSFMLRMRLPGGQLTAEQYLACDELADRFANGTLRITTRQTFQYHGIVKGDLKPTMQALHDQLITTLAACGDVVRNVVCCPAPIDDPIRRQIAAVTRGISDHLLPRTHAYYELWLDDERVHDGEVGAIEEPIYGKTYLPRKFKIAVAYPGDNCVDVYTQDIGLIAVADGPTLLGFNVLVGGGMGMNHTKADTFPRLGDPLGFITPDQVIPVVEEIVLIQRDFGNRTERKHARMKYLVHTWGIDRFRSELEARLGCALQPFAPMPPLENELHLGWQPQSDGRWFLGISVENGRIADTGSSRLKSGLRAAVATFRPGIRLTPNHDILLTDLTVEQRPAVDALLRSYGILPADELSLVQRHAMACVALPTCGLALAESERALPGVIDELEREIARLGLADERISVRMTGCPNGCARPYVADIAFVGRSYDQYLLLLGGQSSGTRLNVPYKDLVHTRDLVQEVVPLLAYFRETRQPGETFGDFCARLGVEALRTWADAWSEAWADKWADARTAAQPGAPAGPHRPEHHEPRKEAARGNTIAAA